MSLTDTLIRNSKPRDKQYKLSDSGGLYLLIKPSGGKYWRFKYRISGKEKLLSIGAYPIITLAEARERCSQAKKLLIDNIDPSQAKREAKLKQAINTENSFKKVALEWHHNQKLSWTPRHAEYIARRLEVNIFPKLGFRPINEVTAPELLSVLRIIEAREALDMSHRMLQTCGQIFRYAIATGRAERDVAADLRGALKIRKREHHSRLEAKELPEFMQKIEEYVGESQTKLALKFLLLTFVRTGELRGAKWSEIDFANKEWRIPAERMKMRDPHIRLVA